MNKYERPIRTGVYYQNCNTISIMGETEKAYFIIYSYDDRRGTSKKIDKVEVERWIPKSIWDNSKNFKEIPYQGVGDMQTHFNPPIWFK